MAGWGEWIGEGIGEAIGQVGGALGGGFLGGVAGAGIGGLAGGGAGLATGPGAVVATPLGAGAGATAGALAGAGLGAAGGYHYGGQAGAAGGKAAGRWIDDTISWMTGAEEEEDRKEADGEEGAATTGCVGECPEPDDDDEKKRKADETHDNIEDYEGQDYDQVERELDQKLRDDGGWTKKPLKRGDGSRYISPDGNRSIRINRGYPQGNHRGPSDSIHSGPYISTPSNGAKFPLN